jgi:hypothetical protein
MRKLVMTLAVVTVMVGTIATRAQAIPLTTLVATNGTIQQGDKLFSNFFAPGFLIGFGDITPTSYSGIDVQGITVNGEHGLRFSGPFTATFVPGESLAFASYLFGFDVTTTDPNFLIHDVRHAYAVTHSGNGSPFQTRNVTAGTDVKTCVAVFCLGPDDFQDIGPSSSISMSPGVLFPSPTVINENFILPHDVDFLRVMQDLSVIGSASMLETDMQAVAFPYIDVTFSQTVVPEPATIVLIGAGLALLVRSRTRAR